MTKVIILHAYDAQNLGDGLLVTESIRLIRDAVGESAQLTMIALRPASFDLADVVLISSRPVSFRELAEYLKTLRRIRDYDLVVAVGGGYLRFGDTRESIKSLLIHLPQLLAASRVGSRAVYLPQSIGPAGCGFRSLLTRMLDSISTVYLRDDRSVKMLESCECIRRPDLALMMATNGVERGGPVDRTPVYSVRYVSGTLPEPVVQLSRLLGVFDGYVQSTVGSNDDSAAVQEIGPRKILTRSAFLSGSNKRVVVAVRLHAALMAIAAGHYVIHLGYERKGWGAFSDLGIPEYVHPVSHFDPAAVAAQVRALSESEEVRKHYDQVVTDALIRARAARSGIVDRLSAIAQSR